MRDVFAQVAIAQIPKILTLQDRNRHSPTYGCFDRNFWQYKIIDFPSGMAQEFVLPLALVYALPIADNPFYQEPALRDWVAAGIHYAAHSAHPDGSCDDYFPFERASGAAAFSLLACVESYTLLGLADPTLLRFFATRADWLAHHHESGQLTNHQALIALCLERVGQLLQSDRWEQARDERLERVLSWQNPEGWFQEYEGCDPGYHTLTLGCLASLYEYHPDPRLQEAIARGVTLASHFVHPDGSYGGEYTSRNTYNFFPHGFELIGRWLPAALAINDRILVGLANDRGACYADDHIIGHHTWSYLLAWRDFVPDRPPLPPLPRDRLWLPAARILIDRREDTTLYLALNKGGAFKLFRGDRLIASDTQFSVLVRSGRSLKNAVGHLVDRYDVQTGEEEILIRGQLGWAKQKQMTPLNLLLLRVVMLTVGRFFPNLIRKLLQKVLITGKTKAPFTFIRSLQWREGQWQITDELRSDRWESVVAIALGGDQTSIYVVMSRTFQMGQLQPWLDLTEKVKQLQPGEPLVVKRSL
ncbi:MAG: hypothetical protein VKK04_09275 [Synechococcales bacterium]|nr:hypothetical protein [Synechococcales bacterium]